jgi:peptidyl-prolyl cis-trans isomerase SurA
MNRLKAALIPVIMTVAFPLTTVHADTTASAEPVVYGPASPTPAKPAGREPVDGIVAQVDDQIVLLSEIEEMRQIMAMQSPYFRRQASTAQRREVLDRIIDEKIVVAKARQDTTIKIFDKDLQPRVEETYQNYVRQSGGEKALELALKQTTGMSPVQFKARLLDQMRDQAYRQRLQMKYVGDQEPSNQQVRAFYAKYQDSLPAQRNGIKLSHIQLRVRAGRALDSTAHAKALEVIARLDKGERFDSLAKIYSDDPSGKEGGDIGYTRKGTLDPDYERAAFGLDAGDYSPRPVHTRHGWHVIKVTGKKDNEVRSSHILVRLIPSAADTAAAQRRADSLRTVLLADTSKADTSKAKASAAFAALARAISDDRQTRDLGGSLGWFPKDQIDESYKAAVDTLPEGGITEPLLIGDSYSLFRVDSRAEERRVTLEEDFAQVAMLAKNWEAGQKLTSFVTKWREGILVEDRLASFTGLPEDASPSGVESFGDSP